MAMHPGLHPAHTTHDRARMNGRALLRLWTPAMLGMTSPLHPARLQRARMDTCLSQVGCPHLLTAIIQVMFLMHLFHRVGNSSVGALWPYHLRYENSALLFSFFFLLLVFNAVIYSCFLSEDCFLCQVWVGRCSPAL